MPDIIMESGKNIKELIEYENSVAGVKLTGYPFGLAQALYKMGFQTPSPPEKPGHLDNIADALESSDNVLYRKNFVGQQVPKRVSEYIEDRQDFILGGLSDLFISPALKIINGLHAGYSLDNEKDAKDFIKGLDVKYPIDKNWEMQASMHNMGWEWTEEGWKRISKVPTTSSGTQVPGASSVEKGAEGGIPNFVNENKIPVKAGDPKKFTQVTRTTIDYSETKND